LIYSFCESVYATGTSSWHIRQLTSKGRMLGGGIDKPSLCGTVKAGWDLGVLLTEHHLGHACRTCVAQYRKETGP